MSLTAIPGPLQVEQMARDWLAACVCDEHWIMLAIYAEEFL